MGIFVSMSESHTGDGLWVFGYGSLVWKPSFKFDKKEVGFIKGWKRRFWQGSTDHRGVPGSPGRVVTLVRPDSHADHLSEKEYRSDQADRTWGVAFHIPEEDVKETLKYLDHREKGGYSRHTVSVFRPDPNDPQKEICVVEASMLYIATEDNEEFLGPDELYNIALQIHESHGPSGPNRDYLLNLAKALDELKVHDQHIVDLSRLVEEIQGDQKTPSDK